ncbi:MAG: hypothetical protein M8353_05390, partial [ANME-2 cluster archaeon]|nr:hypothetical protein [ANME-2 cluster archaeon]
SPNVVNGSVLIGIPTLTAAILVALFAAGIALTVAATAGAAIIAGIVIGIVYMIYAGPDGDFDYWVEISDISKFVDKYTNWWPYDYGIMDSYAGLNRNHYIPIPYGPV